MPRPPSYDSIAHAVLTMENILNFKTYMEQKGIVITQAQESNLKDSVVLLYTFIEKLQLGQLHLNAFNNPIVREAVGGRLPSASGVGAIAASGALRPPAAAVPPTPAEALPPGEDARGGPSVGIAVGGGVVAGQAVAVVEGEEVRRRPGGETEATACGKRKR